MFLGVETAQRPVCNDSFFLSLYKTIFQEEKQEVQIAKCAKTLLKYFYALRTLSCSLENYKIYLNLAYVKRHYPL